jgi:MoaA/NifB/PqqE/SkfB family radical SAM enzyme
MTPNLDLLNGVHLEVTNLCTLKCPGCARTRFIDQWPKHWKNYSLDVDQLMQFLDIDLTGKHVLLCGNYGDPIYHPNLKLLVQSLKNKNATVKIITNGSYRTKSWWENLVECLDSNDQIQFSIDGTPTNFTTYRINADWKTTQDAIEVATNSTCKTMWKHIVFSYNYQTIDEARSVAELLGIDEFVIQKSDRFDTETDYLKPPADYVGVRFYSQENFKKNVKIKVDAKCAQHNEHFISADGYYMPCCYTGDYRFYYKTPFGKNKKQYSIADHTLSEILNSSAVADFYQTLENHSVCQYNCPSRS